MAAHARQENPGHRMYDLPSYFSGQRHAFLRDACLSCGSPPSGAPSASSVASGCSNAFDRRACRVLCTILLLFLVICLLFSVLCVALHWTAFPAKSIVPTGKCWLVSSA